MSRKNIILTVIIVVFLGAAAYIFYSTYFASPSPVPAGAQLTNPNDPLARVDLLPDQASDLQGSPAAPTSSLNSDKILPLGTRFDLTLVKKYNSDGRLVTYPVVSSTEINPPLSDILRANP